MYIHKQTSTLIEKQNKILDTIGHDHIGFNKIGHDGIGFKSCGRKFIETSNQW